MKKTGKLILAVLSISLAVYAAVALLLYNHQSSALMIGEKGSYAEQYARENHVQYYNAADSMSEKLEKSIDQFTYQASGFTCTIIRYNGQGEEVEIPAILDGHMVTAVEANAFDGCPNLLRIYVPDSVQQFEATKLENAVVYCSPDSPTYRQLEQAKQEAEDAARNAAAEEEESSEETDTEEAEETDIHPEKTTEYQVWMTGIDSRLPFEYNVDTDGVEIVLYTDDSDVVVVPSTVNGKEVTVISFPVLRAGIKTVYVPETVRRIESDFSTPRYDSKLYVNLALVLFGYLLAAAATVAASRRNHSREGRFLNLSVIYTGIKYFMIFLAVSALTLFLPIPLAIQIAAVLILAAIGTIELLKTNTAVKLVEETGNRVNSSTVFIKNVVSGAEALMKRSGSPEIRQDCTRVYEALRYSDPMSSRELSVTEAKITLKLEELSDAVKANDADKVKDLAEDIVLLSDERNRLCKSLK